MTSVQVPTADLDLLYRAYSAIIPLYEQIDHIKHPVQQTRSRWSELSDMCLDDLELVAALLHQKKREIEYGIPLVAHPEFMTHVGHLDQDLQNLLLYATSAWALCARMSPLILRAERRMLRGVRLLLAESPLDAESWLAIQSRMSDRIGFLERLVDNNHQIREEFATSFVISAASWWQKGLHAEELLSPLQEDVPSLVSYEGTHATLRALARKWNQEWSTTLADLGMDVLAQSRPAIHLVECESGVDTYFYETKVRICSSLTSRVLTFHGLTGKESFSEGEQARRVVMDTEVGAAATFFAEDSWAAAVDGWISTYIDDFFCLGSLEQSLGELADAIHQQKWQRANFLLYGFVEKRVSLVHLGIGIFSTLFNYVPLRVALKKLLAFQLSLDAQPRWLVLGRAVMAGVQCKGDYAYELLQRLSQDTLFVYDRLRKMIELQLALRKLPQVGELIRLGHQLYPSQAKFLKTAEWKLNFIRAGDHAASIAQIGGMTTSTNVLGYLIDCSDRLILDGHFKGAKAIFEYVARSDKLPHKVVVRVFYNRVVLSLCEQNLDQAKQVFIQLEEMSHVPGFAEELAVLRAVVAELDRECPPHPRDVLQVLSQRDVHLKFMRVPKYKKVMVI
ncbi:MAG: hypothetical protein OXT67_06830 [Zetaproteobacteria bacterium]|nr:hypothetical protein [Zetaproteobacteria bacterium]